MSSTENLGLIRLELAPIVSARRGPNVKPVGERNAGAFDEREEETEQWRGLRHGHLAKAAGQQLFPTTTATASLLDSTGALDNAPHMPQVLKAASGQLPPVLVR